MFKEFGIEAEFVFTEIGSGRVRMNVPRPLVPTFLQYQLICGKIALCTSLDIQALQAACGCWVAAGLTARDLRDDQKRNAKESTAFKLHPC